MTAGSHRLRFGGVTYVMGVINVSPESRNPHTVVEGPDDALDLATRYRRWGADLIDVGGQSSHFENPTISSALEIERVVPVVERLAAAGFVVSIDTWKPDVAWAAVECGAALINDTGGMRSGEMQSLVAATGVGAVAVYVEGENPHAVGEVTMGSDRTARIVARFGSLLESLPRAVRERLILDPGIAVNYPGDYSAYTRQQLEVVRSSRRLEPLGRPLLIPIPRKRDIHWVTAYITMALEYGADI
ncbi:MAG TPA: dihydropteroate synthase, partial [Longimicrobiales bacterium]|nr:dihydropteroate synthase [Longimicrobiales bacterium]